MTDTTATAEALPTSNGPSPELDIPRHFSLVSIATAITVVGIMVLMKVPSAPSWLGWVIVAAGAVLSIAVLIRSIRYIQKGGWQRRTGVRAIPILVLFPLLIWVVLTFAEA
jgi:hypothetical protein